MAKKNKPVKYRESVQLPADKLKLGMYVSSLDRPWLEAPFPLQGVSVDKPEDINTLRNICDFVYIDTLKTRYLPKRARGRVPDSDHEKPRRTYEIQTRIEEEIQQAQKINRASFLEVEQILHRAFTGLPVDSRRMVKVVKSCAGSIIRNPSAMLWLSRIKHVDQYTAEHCLNVGILAMTLGRHIGMSVKQIELLGLCGVLHDVGKMRVEQAILNKPGKLTPDEFDLIKKHTEFGRDVLREDKRLSMKVVNAAHRHHERLDGHGYPDGIHAKNIELHTRIVTIVDAYDAITSRRCYSESKTSVQALKILYENRNVQFDEQLVVKFIECIGVYPPGALVEVDTGEVGVVLSVEANNRLLPKIALVLDADKRPMQQRVIDLMAERQCESAVQHRVRTVLVDGAYGIDLEAFTRQNIYTGDIGLDYS